MASRAEKLLETNAERRMVPRNDVSLGVTLYRVGGQDVIPADIANLSPTGFLAELPDGVDVPSFLDVDLPNAGRRKAQVVWHGGAMVGCTFTQPLSRADISAARLKSTFAEPLAAEDSPMFEIGPSDPIWDMLNETTPEEKWRLPHRVALITAVAIVSWMPVAGLAALFA